LNISKCDKIHGIVQNSLLTQHFHTRLYTVQMLTCRKFIFSATQVHNGFTAKREKSQRTVTC